MSFNYSSWQIVTSDVFSKINGPGKFIIFTIENVLTGESLICDENVKDFEDFH